MWRTALPGLPAVPVGVLGVPEMTRMATSSKVSPAGSAGVSIMVSGAIPPVTAGRVSAGMAMPTV